MFRSRPSDLDLAAWTRSGLDLILCVKLGSGGSGSWGARGGGAARRSSAPWWRSTGVGGLGATGARLGCGLVQKNERDTRGPLGPCTRVRDGRSGVFGGDGGAAAVENAGEWCSGHQSDLHTTTACEKGRGASGSAHRGLVRAGAWRSSEIRRRVAGGARGGGCCSGAPASGLHGSTPSESARPAEGLTRPEWHRRRVIVASSELTCAAVPGAIPTLQGVWSRMEGSRSVLAARRSFWDAWQGWRCSGADGPRRSRGAARQWRGGAGTGVQRRRWSGVVVHRDDRGAK